MPASPRGVPSFPLPSAWPRECIIPLGAAALALPRLLWGEKHGLLRAKLQMRSQPHSCVKPVWCALCLTGSCGASQF